MSPTSVRCLILACGNTLRGDDGVGPWLAQWAEDRFSSDLTVRVITSQQWTPELAEEIANTHSVVFIDCSIESAPGDVQISVVAPTPAAPGLATHHIGASELLALTQELYDSLPRTALQLTIGAGSTDLGDDFSSAVKAALPEACGLLEQAVNRLLDKKQSG